jgi:hypothetical protein
MSYPLFDIGRRFCSARNPGAVLQPKHSYMKKIPAGNRIRSAAKKPRRLRGFLRCQFVQFNCAGISATRPW